jgi:hypothetical protein
VRYLTVHDIVWINAQICGEGVPFDYERLEAGMAAQYAYGDSRNVDAQAARFVERMLRTAPFREGNLCTGLLCTAVFLMANGRTIAATTSALADTVRQVADGSCDGSGLLDRLVAGGHDATGGGGVASLSEADVSLRALAFSAMQSLAESLEKLTPHDGAVHGWSSSPYLHRD